MIINNLISLEQIMDNWKSKILMLTRNDEGKKIITEINDYEPYIYIDEKDKEILKNEFINDIVEIRPEIKEHIIDKKRKIVKVILKNPMSIYKIREKIKCDEADISFTNKWLIDNVEELKSLNKYRINFLDIETTSIEGFPNYLNPKEQIISLACYDNFLDKNLLWIFHEKYKDEIIQKDVEEGKLEIRRFNTEKDMLNNYLDFMVLTKPDFITSWHVSFDVPYLVARLELLKLPVQKMSPYYGTLYAPKFYKGLIEWKQGAGVYGKRFGTTQNEKNVQIKGLYYFDLLTAYKNIIAKEQESFKLDYIAEKELGINKLKVHFDIGAKWQEEPEFIEQYNYIDVYLIKKLDDKLKIINRYTTIRDKSFLGNINDSFSSGRVLDNYILKKNKDKLVFPSKNFVENRDTRIAGGFVREPTAGIYKNIAVFDFSGFYPNLMKTFNLSGEKLINENIIYFDPTTDETLSIEHLKQDKLYEYNEVKKEIIYKINTSKFIADLTYKVDNPGVMTEAVGELMKLRNEAKKEMNKFNYGSLEYEQLYKNQFSYKFLINAAYGTSAYGGFRLFQLHNGNAITAFARMLSKWVSANLILKGWQVIYNDTDSAFVQLHTEELEDNLKETEEINIIIKDFINQFVNKFLPNELAKNHTLEMGTEKIYKSFMLLGVKKRYLGILKYFEGKTVNKFHQMGVDSKKSNTIIICKEALNELSLAVLEDKDTKVVFDKYYKILKKSDDIDLFKIPSKLEQPQESYKTKTPAVKSSLWSNKHLGTKFRAGNKFYLVYVKGLDTESVAFEDKNQLLKIVNFNLDKDKYIEDLYNKFNNLIGAIPKFNQIHEECYMRHKNNQSLLGDYFK